MPSSLWLDAPAAADSWIVKARRKAWRKDTSDIAAAVSIVIQPADAMSGHKVLPSG